MAQPRFLNNSRDAKRKRVRLFQAIQNPADRIGLDSARLEGRLKSTQSQIESLEAESLIAPFVMYACKKTGRGMGMMRPTDVAAMKLAGVSIESLQSYDSQVKLYYTIHPAWIDTSPDRLRVLQRLMPVEYCVYAAVALYPTIAQSIVSLNERIAAKPLQQIVELAEMLRSCNAIIGKWPRQCASLPIAPLFTQDDAINFTGIKQWFCDVIKTIQSAIWEDSIERAKIVSTHDAQRIARDLGSLQFKLSASNSRDDNAAVIDLIEIFDIESEGIRATLAEPQIYRKPGKDIPRFTGVVRTIHEREAELLEAELEAAFADEENAQQNAQQNISIDAASVKKITLWRKPA